MVFEPKMNVGNEFFWLREENDMIDYWSSIAFLPLSESFDILSEIAISKWKTVRFINQWTSLKQNWIELFISKEYDYYTFIRIFLIKFYLTVIIDNFENPIILNWIKAFFVEKSNLSDIEINKHDIEWIIKLLNQILRLLSSSYQEYINASTEEEEHIDSNFEHLITVSKKELCQLKIKSIGNIICTCAFKNILHDRKINSTSEWSKITTNLEIMKTLYLWC